jgi:hypothetical protein
MCQHDDPLPVGGQHGGLRQKLSLPARQHHFGRAQHPAALPGETRCAPVARRRERHCVLAHPAAWRRESLPDRRQCRVAVLVVGERAERLFSRCLIVEPDQPAEDDGPVGEGAGLVEALRPPARVTSTGKATPVASRQPDQPCPIPHRCGDPSERRQGAPL